jgi:hypothetical protein
MMKLNISPAPYPGAPVVVLSAGLGGAAATGCRSGRRWNRSISW